MKDRYHPGKESIKDISQEYMGSTHEKKNHL